MARKIIQFALTVLSILFGFFVMPVESSGIESPATKALIIDGQNNHDAWPKTTVMMRQFLEEHGGFEVDIVRTKYTWKGKKLLKEFPINDGKQYEDLPKPKADPDFAPRFSDYKVVVSNFGYNAAPWTKATQTAFTEYLSNGGGLVIVHAANNSFGDWKAYNQMIGLGGWGGRNEKSGPYVYLDESGKTVRDESAGSGGGHGPQHEFQLVTREPEHPVMKGVPSTWLHAKDELYHHLRGPAENMKILATAFSSKKFRGTDRHEPMIMTLDYGKGRVFHTPMGHADYSMECVGFMTMFVRGTQWAADPNAELMDVPEDFPTRDKSATRDFKMLVDQK